MLNAEDIFKLKEILINTLELDQNVEIEELTKQFPYTKKNIL